MAAVDSETDNLSNTVPGKIRRDFAGRPAAFFRQPKEPRRGHSLGYLATIFKQAVLQRSFIILVPFALVLGIVIYRFAQSEPSLLVTCGVTVATGWMAVMRSRKCVAYGWVIAAAVFSGFCLMNVHSKFFGTKMLSYPIVTEQAELMVAQIIGERASGTSILVSVDRSNDRRLDGIKYARLTIKPDHKTDQVRVGDVVSGRIRFAPVPKSVVVSGYDAQFSSYFSGIGAYASSLGPVAVRLSSDIRFQHLVDGARGEISDRIDGSLSAQEAAIAKALIIGDQTDIAAELRDQIAKAGLAHVLAISGLHLTLVVGTALILSRALFVSLRISDRWVRPSAIGIAVIVALAYLLVSGSNLATQRATIMLLLAFGAMLFGRRAITMRNAALAALLIITLFPAEIFKPGFQLSFAAVLGLVAAYSETRKMPFELPAWAKGVSGLAFTSIVAGIVTAPIAAFHFQQFAPFGLIGNLIAVPIVGFWVLPFGFLSVLLMPFGLEQIGLVPMGWGIGIVVEVAQFIAYKSGALTVTPVYANWTIFTALFALAWLSFFSGWIKLVGPGVFALAFLLFGATTPPSIIVSDATQGVVVRTSDGFAVLGRKSNSFTLRVWAERFDAELLERDAIGQCDRRGCFAKTDLGSIAIAKTTAAFHEECGQVDVLIMKMRGDHRCETSMVILQSQLDENGVAYLYPDQNTVWRVDWAIKDHGKPWRP